jgi:hypothetical protein
MSGFMQGEWCCVYTRLGFTACCTKAKCQVLELLYGGFSFSISAPFLVFPLAG